MKLRKLAAACLMAVLTCTPAFADGSSYDPIIISTSVDGTLVLTVAMHKNDPGGQLVPYIEFGTLVPSGNSLVSSTSGSSGTGSIVMLITTNSHGVPYTVTQTGTSLSNGTTTLPAGACTVVPSYSAADNSGLPMPGGAALGSSSSWVAVNKTLYTSGPSGSLRTFEATYRITDDAGSGATAGVPLFQQLGDYAGTITITATT